MSFFFFKKWNIALNTGLCIWNCKYPDVIVFWYSKIRFVLLGMYTEYMDCIVDE